MQAAAGRSLVKRLQIDHLVYAVPGTLDEAVAAFAAATGVQPIRGGSHAGLGTFVQRDPNPLLQPIESWLPRLLNDAMKSVTYCWQVTTVSLR